MQYGRNYAGNRDDCVYIVSPDADDAYTPADRMVMARAPKNRVREQSAWEYFRGLDQKGRPLWSKRIGDRGTVFQHPKRCYRSGLSYHPTLKRYLWSQIVPGAEDMRFRGGFGIYDASEPWGPWTTAYFTEDWDVGPGETSSFPTKWMEDDGKTLHLVFSGDDHFAVRRATLHLASSPRRHNKD